MINAAGLDLTIKLDGTGTEEVCFDLFRKMFHWKKSTSNFEGSAFNEDMGISAPMRHDFETGYKVEF